jgi:hypothetical protein
VNKLAVFVLCILLPAVCFGTDSLPWNDSTCDFQKVDLKLSPEKIATESGLEISPRTAIQYSVDGKAIRPKDKAILEKLDSP